MNTAPDKTRGPSPLVVLSLLFVAALGIRTISSGSFWIHLASGRQIAAHGLPANDPFSFALPDHRPWLNDSWLYDWILYILWQAGSAPAVILAHVASLLASLALLASIVQRRAGPASVGVALLTCGWLLAPQFTISPFIFASFLPAFFMAILSRERIGKLMMGLLLAAQVLWTNLHVTFWMGPVIAALATLQIRPTAGQQSEPAEFTWRLGLTTLMIGATLINPYGIRLPAVAIHRILDPNLSVSMEWISPYVSTFDFPWGGRLITLLLALVAAGFIFIRGRLPLMLTTLAVIGAFLLVRSPRFSALSVLLVFPFLSLSLNAMGGAASSMVPRLSQAARWATFALMVLSLGCVFTNSYYRVSGSPSIFGLGVQNDVFPVYAVREAIPPGPLPARMLNLPMDGGYLSYHRAEEKIFCDTRLPLYGSLFYQNFLTALRGDADLLKKTLDAWKPGSILLNCTWLGAADDIRWLLASGAWALAYFDGTSAWLVSDPRHLSPALQKAGLDILESSRRDYEKQLGRFPSPGNPSRLIGAATVFQALGKYREAEAIFSLLTRGTPGMASAWLGLCNSQVEQLKFELALQNMSKADPRLSNQGRVWLWVSLHRAYLRAGNKNESENAMQRARSLDVDLANLFAGTNQQRSASSTLGGDTGSTY